MLRKTKKYLKILINLFLYWDGYAPQYIFFEKQKLIYIQIEKCWSSSILECLKVLLPKEKQTNDIMKIHWQWFKKIKKITKNYLSNEYTIFTVVRDPLERLISCYQQKYWPSSELKLTWKWIFDDYLFWYLKNPTSLEDFLTKILKIPVWLMEPHFKPMFSRIQVKNPQKNVLILNLDNLSKDFEPVRTKYNLPALKHLNDSHTKNKNPIKISNTLLEKIKKIYKSDFELYDYATHKK